MPARLKTYRAHLGFFDTIVAAPSQRKALEAWGSSQDLFREGFASVTDDPGAVTAASAKPGVVLKRPAGSREPYSEHPSLPEVSGRTKPKPLARQSRRDRVAEEDEPEPEPPDRCALDRAEKAIADLRRERERTRKSFAERRDVLQADEERAERDFANRERALGETLAREKRAFEKAGGRVANREANRAQETHRTRAAQG